MQAVQSIIVEFIKELEKHVRGWETVNIIQWHLVKSVPGLAVCIPWLVPTQECYAKSQCNAEHKVCNAIQWRIMKDDDGALLYNTHIEVGVAPLCPCTLTDPDSWQLSTSTPASCPPSPSFIPQGWRHFFRWTNWRLPDFSHLPYKVCNLDIFCPFSHRQPRQVKTCQPGQLRWSIIFNLQSFHDWWPMVFLELVLG